MKKNKHFIILIAISLTMVIFSGCVTDSSTNSNEKEIVPITYVPVEDMHTLEKIRDGEIKTVLVEKKIVTNKILIFTKVNNEEKVYGGIEINEELYGVGQIGYTPTDTEVFNIKETRLFSKELIRIDGFCGINCPQSDYIWIDKSIPKKILHIEAGVIEMDLNSDGQEEIVASVGTPANTKIYKLENGQIVTADLNKSFDALDVSFDRDQKTFRVMFKDKTVKLYKFNDEGLIEV